MARRTVPYVVRDRVAGFRRVRVLIALGALGLAGIAAIFLYSALTAASSDFDGWVYLQSNRATTGRNSVMAFRVESGKPRFVRDYPTSGTGVIDPGGIGALDADQQLTYDRRRRLLFAVNQGSDSVAVFHVGRDGRLTPAAGSPFATRGKAPGSVGVVGDVAVVADKAHDPGRALDFARAFYDVFRIRPNGSLEPVGTPFALRPGSSPTGVLPLTDRLVVASEETGPFRTLVVGHNGALFQGSNSPVAPEKSLFEPGYEGVRWSIGLVRSPDENLHLLYMNTPQIARLLVYSWDESGRLTFVTSAANEGAKLPCWTAITPDGRHLYTANAANGSVSAFSLGRDRRSPRRIQRLALEHGGNPWAIGVDPSGKTLFVVDARAASFLPKGLGNRLHVLAVDGDGKLEEVHTVKLPLGAGASALGIAVVPEGR